MFSSTTRNYTQKFRSLSLFLHATTTSLFRRQARRHSCKTLSLEECAQSAAARACTLMRDICWSVVCACLAMCVVYTILVPCLVSSAPPRRWTV